MAPSLDSSRVLVGEAWFSAKAVSRAAVERASAALAKRQLPPLADDTEVVRALFVPLVARDVPRTADRVHIVTLRDLLG